MAHHPEIQIKLLTDMPQLGGGVWQVGRRRWFIEYGNHRVVACWASLLDKTVLVYQVL